MATLQVKRVPDDLYAQVKSRAEDEGISLSEYVLRTLRRDVALPSMRQWLEQVRSAPVRIKGEVDVQAVLDEVKDEIEGR